MQDLVLKTLLAEKHARELGFMHTASVLKKQADRLLYEHPQQPSGTLGRANTQTSSSVLPKFKVARSKE